MHLYLNNGSGPSDEELAEMDPKERVKAMKLAVVGGATTFHSMYGHMDKKLDVMPKSGRILLFQQRGLLHSGDDLIQGEKYTVRTDLMYTLESSKEDC